MRFHAMKRVSVAAVVAITALVLTACSSNHGAGMMTPSGTSGASAADAMFAQMMIPHHEQAVVMSELATTRASSPEIQALAAEIKAAQQPEIDQMKAWLTEWGIPVMSGMDAMSEHGGHGMSGMLTDDQLAELEAASGQEFDTLFAEYMILHHEGAIDMAEDVVDSRDPRVAALAQAIIQTQQVEIDQMKAFLAQGGAGASAASASSEPSNVATEGDAEASPSVVDLAAPLDHVHAVVIVGGDLLVGTHSGVVEVDPTTGATSLRGTSRDDFMGLAVSGSTLVASGHPGQGSSLPDPLGLLRSTDSGATWDPVSLTGQIDFHALAVDGRDVAGQSTTEELMYSADGGSTWQVAGSSNATSLAWFDGRLWIANGQGLVSWSTDGQTADSDLGPAVFLAAADDGSALWAVLIDGTVHRSTDGSTWNMVGSVPEATYLAATSDTAFLVSPAQVHTLRMS